MGYVLMVLLLGFGWYWNKGFDFKPFYLPAPDVDGFLKLVVNIFTAVVIVMVALNLFGVGR